MPIVSPRFSLIIFSLCASIPALAKPTSSATTTVSLDGFSFVNKGIVGFGVIPSDFKESTGDTIGGIGSAIAFKPGTWKSSNGTYSGTLVVHPDRGFNVDGTVDYQARQHEINFVLNPYTSSVNLDFASAQTTLQLTYMNTVLQVERNSTKTSGLDPDAIRPAQSGFPSIPTADPQMPIASTSEPHLTIDAEGIVANTDGTFWVSDEYGPYIYRFSANGDLIQTIQPPSAVLPRTESGALNFTSDTDPATGRAGNQGFEGLTFDVSTGTLYAMLQSATIQDGGDDKSTSRFTRLFAWNVANLASPATLVGEWVVPLPQSSKGNTEACSEIHFVSPNIFFALSRDGDGHGGDDNKSSYKQADLFSIANATDIHGFKFDDPANPIAKKGKLDKSITPATYVSFVNFLDSTQLARFGLHNGSPDDETLIDAKWESLALAPVNDPSLPNDYFLFTASDNDFLSTHGVSLGVPFDAGIDVDNEFLVFQLTLPSVNKNNLNLALGLN
ncbi:esterase-like activity of phytase-domain-containing protein [Cyathus striatus]|nr:esterase-like activity of phytase-domain-containing protein [Cyathus striatus]